MLCINGVTLALHHCTKEGLQMFYLRFQGFLLLVYIEVCFMYDNYNLKD